MKPMKLISLNVEGTRHWDTIVPFLEKESPDVLCLQEAFENDVTELSRRFGMHYAFGPMMLRQIDFDDDTSELEPFGVALLARTPLRDAAILEYHPTGKPLQKYVGVDLESRRASIRQVLVTAEVESASEGPFRIATTHFTWTPDGLPNSYQEEDAEALIGTLAGMPPLALCGDFNMPQGINYLYERFAAEYRDAIPASYASSIDLSLHRERGNAAACAALSQTMTDYLFLGEGYETAHVRLEGGVSDHFAVVAQLKKA